MSNKKLKKIFMIEDWLDGKWVTEPDMVFLSKDSALHYAKKDSLQRSRAVKFVRACSQEDK